MSLISLLRLIFFVDRRSLDFFIFFFFNDTATTEIYTLSLHDALPICSSFNVAATAVIVPGWGAFPCARAWNSCSRSMTDRKSTRLNSSHQIISYAVFCLKKKKVDKYKSTEQFYH